MKKISEKSHAKDMPAYVRNSVAAVAKSGQLSKLSPILYWPMELRRLRVSENWHLLTDIAREIYTKAYHLSVEKQATHSCFAEYDAEDGIWKPRGTMSYDSEQRMFYNKKLYADLVRQLKQIGFIDMRRYAEIGTESRLPLMPNLESRHTEYLYQERFSAISEMAELQPFSPPKFLADLGIKKKKYQRIVLYVEQNAFIRENFEQILQTTDWLDWAGRSLEYQEHASELSFEWAVKFGLL